MAISIASIGDPTHSYGNVILLPVSLRITNLNGELGSRLSISDPEM